MNTLPMRTADETEWRDGEPFDGGALRGLLIALPLSLALYWLLWRGLEAAARAWGGA